ncbi:MAG: DUF2161 family putative PD-(D/E)XK-type phosphodiesterase [Defluviitaleaceae bacterium]|nr:DUF2161 family putative PD-(D/E)XK-type phosphodiesterase [Defluviitaleaceae bacterium]MCL2836531.1 DUF2161 family putative PD-(D/E)XK-type phosphodiesterase [Defluviitaleaceae bacterium]
MPVRRAKKDFNEADMYKPVKDFFTGLGYAVNAEVLGIDICLRKDGVLTVIELKKSLNMTLLCQAVDRQSVTSQVYVAVPRPRHPHSRENELARRIVKRLGLGLIYVKMDSALKGVEIAHFPPAEVKTASKKRRERVVKEIEGRTVDVNTGGQTKKPIATAYRERAVKTACALEKGGALTVRELRGEYDCDPSVSYILRNNHYGWFERVSVEGRNIRYGLSAKGIEMLLDESAGGDFMELIKVYREEILD